MKGSIQKPIMTSSGSYISVLKKLIMFLLRVFTVLCNKLH